MKAAPVFIITVNRVLALALALGLSACGSSVSNLGNVGVPGDTNVVGSIADGVFRDSNVSGLKYISASQAGVTDTTGAFKYVNGEGLTFSVGGINLGNAIGKAVISPLDLVPSGTASTDNVLNIARFLMLLDNNAEPRDGIVISQAVQSQAQNWPQIDFSGNLESALNAPADPNTNTSILDDLANLGETHILPSATTAKDHLESTLLCTYSGAFGGSFGGSDSGTIGLYIDPITGNADGFIVGSANPGILPLTHTSPLRFDITTLPVVASSTTDGNYTFQFTSIDSISGNWTAGLSGNSGTFTASRGGTDQTLQWRISGSYKKNDGTDAGVFAFGVNQILDPNNISITGEVFSVSTVTSAVLSGSIVLNGSASTLSAQTGDNRQLIGIINLDSTSQDYLTLSGSWGVSNSPSVPAGADGTFQGRGCVVY